MYAFDIALVQTCNIIFSFQISVCFKKYIKKSLPIENTFQSTRTKVDFYVRK